MGLLNNLLISLIHLLFVMMDLMLLMILIKGIYRLWRFNWLMPVNNIIEPALSLVTYHFGYWIRKVTGKIYTERILLILLIVGMTFLRFLIIGLSSN